jgi:hypothetical protein
MNFPARRLAGVHSTPDKTKRRQAEQRHEELSLEVESARIGGYAI